MRKLLAVLLACSFATGCATVRRHPTATKWGIVSLGLVAGAATGLATRGVHCPAVMYEGHIYDGTSPGCPKPEPGTKK